MPILQRIELSNFLNSGRTKPWRPDWPHQILEINGENAALNIPNGKGKSTMVTAILAMLTSHGKSLKDIRTRFFAPSQTGHFTHIRIQVLIPIPGASGDLVALSGGDLGGQTMVFGMYGYSGENEKLEVYAYQGAFEDCPVAHVHELHHTLIADDAFLGQLRTCTNLFPGNAKERTRRAWIAYVEDFFDMSSLKQQLIYQLMRGAEGGHGYFEVKPPAGMNYSAAVFYERLAPELLTDVMGDLGEEGEHGIEDTIHEKVSKVISAKHETARKAEELRRAGNTLRELAGALELGSKLKDAKQAYDQHLGAFSVEMAVLKDVVVDAPIPGIPRTPPETIPKISRSMVMKDGQWFLSDRVMAEFTGEQTSAVNQRAHDRNGLELVHASRSQLIDFACDIKIRDARGKPNQLYSRESALALLKFTSNFTRDWTREKAIDLVTQAFDWVEAHADTNPARALKKRLKAELATKSQERVRLSNRYKDHQTEKEKLQDEQTHVGEQQSEYRRMADSRLFTEEELASPAQTGHLVGQELEKAAKSLDDHKDKVRRLKPVYEGWQAFLHEYGESISPAKKAMQLENASEEANRLLQETQSALKKARDLRKPLDITKEAANKRFNELDAKLKRFIEALPARDRFIKLFGEASPVGLAKQVTSDRDQTRNRLSSIEGDRNKFRPFIEALAMFQAANGDVDPDAWLLDRLNRWETLGREVEQLKGDLDEAGVRRSALDQAVIVAGKVTREAVAIAGGKSVPVHEAVVKMQLPTDRRESVLTLFSALLHAPVYQTIGEAVEAAGRLAKAGVEAPVFVLAELEEFCRTGVISRDAMAAHTWLVGVRTRQVDCLLDPTLVEREKALIDKQVQDLTQVLSTKQSERTTCSPESEETTLARRASEGVKHGYQEKDAQLATEQDKLKAMLPDLEAKASTESLADIAQVERHYREFAQTNEPALRDEHTAAELDSERAADALEINNGEIESLEKRLDTQQKSAADATLAADKNNHLQRIQAFIDHAEENPAFMAEAGDAEATLDRAKSHADQRTRFRFEVAELFVKGGPDRPRQIEQRLNDLKAEQHVIQDRLLPPLNEAIESIENQNLGLIKKVMEIDEFVRGLIKKYREFTTEQEDLATVTRDQIERHPLGGFALGLREEDNLEDLVRMLIDIESDIQIEDSSELRQAMKDAKEGYQRARSSLASLVDKILVMGDLDLTEHVRLELARAKENPAIVDHLHAVAKNNYEKNQAANATATAYLESEWENIGKWLKAFTQRLPDNLRIMKAVFGPGKDKDGNLGAGFEIEATEANQDDIKAVLDKVVEMVEKYESTKHAVENAAPGLRDQAIRGIRAEIRNTFYQKVILNPRIKVRMPSISQHSLPLEKNMVSTGQGVAMTLLWIVKMADYVTERELRRVTTSRAQQKHLHPTQFAIMDGAFSSLSNKGLIRDALDSIKRTRGRFQLIITGHDENYQNNFEYFPTLIEAREINGQFMYADSRTRRILQPEEVGSHYGAIGLMNLRVKPTRDAVVEH